MSKKVKFTEETVMIHKKMAELFKPVDGMVLIEFFVNDKSSSGNIHLTGDATKSVCHPVVAVPDVKNERLKNIEPGDWVVVQTPSFNVFKVFGRDFAFISDFTIVAKTDISYLLEDAKFLKMKEEEEEKRMAELRAEKFKNDLIN